MFYTLKQMDDDYPYYNTFVTKKEVKESAKRLAKYTLSLETKSYRVTNIPNKIFKGETFIVEYNEDDIISNFYNEKQRVLCKRYDTDLNVFDFWNANKNKLKVSYKSNKALYDALYKAHFQCATFKPSILVGFIKKFNSKSVLDFSGGWGDRLLAMLITGVDGVVVDPNEKLHDGYKQMIKDFANDRSKYETIASPFQTAEIPGRPYDLVFTSPPYFNLETYTGKNQSYVAGMNMIEWKNTFLYPSLEKAWSVLQVGGHMCIIINDTKKDHYCLDMAAYCNTFPGATECRVISYASERGEYQPIWIWTKTDVIYKNPLNPELAIEQYKINNITVNVFQEGSLIGGTKQRGLVDYIKMYPADEYIYAGPNTGAAQVALAYACKETNKRCTLFLQGGDITPLATRALAYHPKVYSYPSSKLKVVMEESEKYMHRTKKAKNVEFGMGSVEYIKVLIRRIKEALPKGVKPKRIWVTVGSGTLLKILSEVFPTARFVILLVGRPLYIEYYSPELLERIDERYVSLSKFTVATRILPPYASVATYDAKAWQLVMKYAKDGDYIWNTAADDDI